MNVMSAIPEGSGFYGLTAKDADEVMRLPDGTAFGNATDYRGSWGTLVAEYST
jgi:hypothetical protein